MLVNEITERRASPKLNVKVPFSQQVQQIIQRNGGTIDDYWVSSTSVDRLGFYGGDKSYPISRPGKAPVVPTQAFQSQRKFRSPEYATYAVPLDTQPKNVEQKYGLWFMPLKASFQSLNHGMYPYLRKFVWLVKLNDDAWVQPVSALQRTKANLLGAKPPKGQHKIGQQDKKSGINGLLIL